MTAPLPPGRLAVFQARQLAQEGLLLRKAFVASEWKILHAAAWLGVQVSSVQRMLTRHPAVEEERQRKMLERGGSSSS